MTDKRAPSHLSQRVESFFGFARFGVLQERAPDEVVAGKQQQRVLPLSGQRHHGGRLQQDDGEGDDQHGDEPHRSGPGQVQHRGRAQPGTGESSASERGRGLWVFSFSSSQPNYREGLNVEQMKVAG